MLSRHRTPIVPTLLRLGAPNVLIMLAQAGVGPSATFFVGKLGTDATKALGIAGGARGTSETKYRVRRYLLSRNTGYPV